MWRARRAEFFCACYALKYTISMRKRQVRAIGMGDWYGRLVWAIHPGPRNPPTNAKVSSTEKEGERALDYSIRE